MADALTILQLPPVWTVRRSCPRTGFQRKEPEETNPHVPLCVASAPSTHLQRHEPLSLHSHSHINGPCEQNPCRAGRKPRPGAPPVKDGAHPRAVGAVPVDVQPGGQEDPVLHGDGPVGEGGDEQLIPAWREEGARSRGSVPSPNGAATQPSTGSALLQNTHSGLCGPHPQDCVSRNEAPEHLCSGNASSFWVQTRAIKALRSPAHGHPPWLCLTQVFSNPVCPGRCLPTRAGCLCHGAAAANLVQAANSPVTACHVGHHKIVNY